MSGSSKKGKTYPKVKFLCPECGEMKMSTAQRDSTNACGDCETKPLPWDGHKKIKCWNKKCGKWFIGRKNRSDEQSLCPICLYAIRGTDVMSYDES